MSTQVTPLKSGASLLAHGPIHAKAYQEELAANEADEALSKEFKDVSLSADDDMDSVILEDM